ncbi:MAG: glycosyltransferase family 2 protein [Coriobacteriia bacterium]|nr:glycosyltransferase family 2 protein [Coriobacteriia bacterium]
MITVSIIIPIYNGEQVLRQCLDSVLSQTLKNLEVICIDDGSTDSTKAIILEYRARDPRIQLLEQQNSGAAVARNRGIRVAQGEYLAFIDADDLYPTPHILQTLYQNAKDQQVSICGGSMGEFRANSKRIITYWYDPYQDGYTFTAPQLINYADYQFDFGWTRFIYKRSLLIEHGIWQPERRYFEDPPFFVQAMSAAGRFFAIPDITYLYRWSAGKKHRLSTKELVLDAFAGIEHNIRFAHDKDYRRLLEISVHRLCKTLELIDTNDLSIIERQLELLRLLESYPGAEAEAARFAHQLQWQFVDEKNMLKRFKLTRISLFLKRLNRFIKRRLGILPASEE